MSSAKNEYMSFNTQPPEGGWILTITHTAAMRLFQHTAARRRLDRLRLTQTSGLLFQHTAARRRLVFPVIQIINAFWVSTHSRPKAAGNSRLYYGMQFVVSTHSRPKAAGIGTVSVVYNVLVSTHSRPKAAGRGTVILSLTIRVSTHSRPKAAG